MELVEQTETLLRLRHTEDAGYGVAAALLAFALYGVVLAVRGRRKQAHLVLARLAGAGMMCVLAAVFLYFQVRTTEVTVDRARGEVDLRERTLLGNTPREVRVPVASITAVEVAAGRRGSFQARLLRQGSEEPVPLVESWRADQKVEQEAATRVRDFLGLPGQGTAASP
jgi:hypothetical protein